MKQKGHACRQAGFAPIVIVIIVTLLLIVGGAVYFRSQTKQSISQTSQQTSPVSISQSDETANWKTYTNQFDSYSFNYPSNWFLYPASAEGNGTDLADTDLSLQENIPQPDDVNHIRVNIVVFHNTERWTLRQWLDKNDKKNFFEEHSVLIGGINGLYRREPNSEFLQIGELDETSSIYLSHENKIYRILIFPVKSKYKSIFDQILFTFRFE